MITVYGIPNCDKVRAARKWLESEGIAHDFHDFRKDGIVQNILFDWTRELGWDALLNNRSRTWREIPESERADIDEARAVALMVAHPTLIKRPVIDLGRRRIVGFGPAQKEEIQAS